MFKVCCYEIKVVESNSVMCLFRPDSGGNLQQYLHHLFKVRPLYDVMYKRLSGLRCVQRLSLDVRCI